MILAFILLYVSPAYFSKDLDELGLLLFATLAIVSALMSRTVLFSVRALLAQSKAQPSLGSPLDIAALEPEEYATRVIDLDERAMTRELAIHTAALSRVAQAKAEHLSKAIRSLRLSLIALVILIPFFVTALSAT